MAEFHCFPSFAQTQLIQQIFIVPGTVPCAREQNYYMLLSLELFIIQGWGQGVLLNTSKYKMTFMIWVLCQRSTMNTCKWEGGGFARLREMGKIFPEVTEGES